MWLDVFTRQLLGRLSQAFQSKREGAGVLSWRAFPAAVARYPDGHAYREPYSALAAIA